MNRFCRCATISLIAAILSSSVGLADTTIPLIAKSNNWYLNCTFNNVPANCMLDSGTYQTIIPGSLQKESKDYPVVPYPYPDPDGTWRSVNLTLGSDLTYETKAVRYNDEVAYNSDGSLVMSDGIIGMPALDGRVWKFDFVSNQLVSESEIPKSLATNNIQRKQQGHFAIPLTVLDVPVVALYDTGTESGLYVDVSIFEKIKSQLSDCKEGTFTGSKDGKEVTVPIQFCPNVETIVGGAKISVDLIALDFSQDRNMSRYLEEGWTGMLGQPAMKGHVWHFDFKKNLWSLER